jgi:hypothetical protein
MVIKLLQLLYVVGSGGVVLQVGLFEGDFSGVCAYLSRIAAIGPGTVVRCRRALLA